MRILRDSARFGRVIPAEVMTAKDLARQIRDNAQNQAEAIVRAARDEADEIRRQSVAAGQREAEQELAAKYIALAREREQTLKDAEHSLVDIAISSARRIIQNELAIQPNQAASIVREALKRSQRAQKIILRVHPDDMPALESTQAHITEGQPSESVQIVSDPDIERGGCLVISELGQIDARLSTQLDSLRAALLRAL